MAEPEDPLARPVLLTETHDIASFNSGEPVLDDWLRQRAWANLQSAASRTYVVCPAKSQRVVGYYAVCMGQILAQEVTGSMRRNMPRQIPAVVLARLAIDRAWQGKGLGRVLLGDATRRALLAATQVSCRLMIVHAISLSAEAFYLHHGFTRLPVEAPMFAVDLVKLRTLAAERDQPTPKRP